MVSGQDEWHRTRASAAMVRWLTASVVLAGLASQAAADDLSECLSLKDADLDRRPVWRLNMGIRACSDLIAGILSGTQDGRLLSEAFYSRGHAYAARKGEGDARLALADYDAAIRELGSTVSGSERSRAPDEASSPSHPMPRPRPGRDPVFPTIGPLRY
jgi:hypothetical protein